MAKLRPVIEDDAELRLREQHDIQQGTSGAVICYGLDISTERR